MLCKPDPIPDTTPTEGRKSADAASINTAWTTTTSSTLTDEKPSVPAPIASAARRSFLSRLFGRKKEALSFTEKPKLIDEEVSFDVEKTCPVKRSKLPIWRGETIRSHSDANLYDWDRTYKKKSGGKLPNVPFISYEIDEELARRLFTYHFEQGQKAVSAKQLYEWAAKHTPIGTKGLAIKIYDTETKTYKSEVLDRNDDRAVFKRKFYFRTFSLEHGKPHKTIEKNSPAEGMLHFLTKFNEHGVLQTAACMYV